MSLPTELYRSIIECLLQSRHYKNKIICAALVCREWRNQVYAAHFRNLDIAADILAIRSLTSLCEYSQNSIGSSVATLLLPLGSFVRYITITLCQPTGHGMIALSDLTSLLGYTPNIEDLGLSIIQPDQLAREIDEIPVTSINIQQLTSLRIRSYVDISDVLASLVTRCPALRHLSLEVYADNSTQESIQQIAPTNLVSFRSLGFWEPSNNNLASFILSPSNTSLRAIELHRSPSIGLLQGIASIHGTRIECLTLRSMEPASTRIWAEIFGQFTALQHLSMWIFPSEDLLDSVNTDDLRHFEFWRPYTHSRKDENKLRDVISFLGRCPVLSVVTYHAAKQIPEVDQIAQDRGVIVHWQENHCIETYVEDPRDFLAAPYTSWRAHAFPVPLPILTKPKGPKLIFDEEATGSWDLPIHSAKSDLLF